MLGYGSYCVLMQQINGTKLKVMVVSIVKTEGRGFIIQLPTPCFGLWKSMIFTEKTYWKGDSNMKKQIHNAKHSDLSLLCKSLEAS